MAIIGNIPYFQTNPYANKYKQTQANVIQIAACRFSESHDHGNHQGKIHKAQEVWCPHSLVEISPMTSWLWILLNYQKDPKGIKRAYSTRNTITFMSMAKIVAHREWSEVSALKIQASPRQDEWPEIHEAERHPSISWWFHPNYGVGSESIYWHIPS